MSAGRCSNCGEHEVVYVEHDPPLVPEAADDDGVQVHPYCRNCDAGLCCGDC